MVNLLPRTIKKQNTREYYTRVVVVLNVLLAFTFFVGALSLVPTFVTILVEQHVLESRHTTLTEQFAADDDDRSTKDIIKTTNIELKQLNERQRLTRPSTLVALALEKRNSGVVLTRIGLQSRVLEGGEEVLELHMEGEAETRTQLIEYSNALEEVSSFDDIVLPIGNLAQSINPHFSLTLTSPAHP